MNTKEKIKQYLDANVHDGEDRKGCHCDKAVFTPDELQELVEEACEYDLKEEKPKTIDFTQLPVDTLVMAEGKPLYFYAAATDRKVDCYVGGKDSGSDPMPKYLDRYDVKDVELIEGRKVVWEGGECPLPDGVEVVVGWRDGTISIPHNCTSIGDGWLQKNKYSSNQVSWYQITGRIV